MLLLDCIRKLNPLHLKAITERYGLVLIPFSSRAARDALINTMSQPGFVTQCIGTMNANERCALMLIVMLARYAPAEAITSIARHACADAEEPGGILQNLLNTGIVFLARLEGDNINRYIIPDEMHDELQTFAQAELEARFERFDGTARQELHEHRSMELSALAVLIDTIKHDIRLNIDKTLGKRTVNRLVPFLGLPVDMVDESTVDTYINTMFAYLTEYGLISKEHHVQIPAVDQWIALESDKQREMFFDFLMYSSHVPHNMRYFACILSHMPADERFDISALWRLSSMFFYTDTPLDEFAQQPFSRVALLLLFITGVIALQFEDIHRFGSWRITPVGKSLLTGKPVKEPVHETDNHIIIQPNFEFMISRNADLDLLWKMYRFSDMVQCEQLLRFHLSRDTIYRGMASGVRKEDIISVLEQHAKGAVAQNVIYSVQEWCEEYGAVYFMDVFLLRCKTKHIAEHIAVHPKTRDFIKGTLSDTDLIVKKSDVIELISLLKTLGFMPLEDIVRPEDETRKPPQMKAVHHNRNFLERYVIHIDINTVKLLSDLSELT